MATRTKAKTRSRKGKTLSFERRIPVRHTVDVFVAGGGPAGIAAAVAAARQGASVFLAEKHTCLGGMGTAGLIPVFMQFSDGVNMLAAGIGEEVLTKLREAGGTGPDSGATIRAEVLKRVYDALLLEAGVDFTFETRVVAVENAGPGELDLAVCAAKSGLFAVRARMFVDGTGDGDLAAWAGAPFEKGDADGHMMPGTLCSLWADVDWDTVRKHPGPANRHVEQAHKDKVFTHCDRHVSGMWRVGEHMGGGNIGHTFGVDNTDERSVTEALIWGRRMLLEYERYYKEYLEGYEKMELVATGSLLGVRETRRILGDYVLIEQDCRAGAASQKHTDMIAISDHAVDIHGRKGRLYEVPNGPYGVPYRCLLPKGAENLLIASRAASFSHIAASSCRLSRTMMTLGQAAGTAAAACVQKRVLPRQVDVGALQAALKAQGVAVAVG
ncbi:FAD-dependent oxidoreductase [bacterium]|nr:FAD-dependent oxidoreductase [bacterium]